MKSAEKWLRQNATNGMYCSRRRRVLVDGKVRASRVLVGRVRSQQMAKMPLAEHDNVVKTFPPDRTDRPFTIPVVKSSQLHSYRLIGRKPSWLRMSFTPSTDVSSGS